MEHNNEPSAKFQSQGNNTEPFWQHSLGQVFSHLGFCSYCNHEAGKQEFSLLIHTTLFIHNKNTFVYWSHHLCFFTSPEMDSENIPEAHNSSCTVQGKQTLNVFKSTLLEFIVVFLKFAASKLSLTHLFLQQNQNKPSE